MLRQLLSLALSLLRLNVAMLLYACLHRPRVQIVSTFLPPSQPPLGQYPESCDLTLTSDLQVQITLLLPFDDSSIIRQIIIEHFMFAKHYFMSWNRNSFQFSQGLHSSPQFHLILCLCCWQLKRTPTLTCPNGSSQVTSNIKQYDLVYF